MLTLIITNMEGTLWKWTNYFSGWQPRWFVLDGGILSYYKSQEEVNTGCKGSINMTVCDVVVHHTDNTRLDLIIPGEQHFYVKAATPQERQLWLVALGTSKACAATGTPPIESGLFTYGELSPDILRTKKSELRLYCDLLMQQVHAVKTIAKGKQTADIDQYDEATSLLSATCDTFIQTLEDCMTLASANINSTPRPPSISISSVPHSPSRGPHKRNSSSRNSTYRSNSSESGRPRPESQSSYSRQSSRSSVSSDRAQSESPQPSPKPALDSIADGDNSAVQGREVHQNNMIISTDLETSFTTEKTPSFFTSMSHSFMDLRIPEDGEIPVEPYLECCQSLVPLFDMINATTMAPVKMDFTGNIKKLREKFNSNPSLFTSLQKMVQFEVQAKQSHHAHSATVALLWNKRGLDFIRGILHEILIGSEDLYTAISDAYGRTLRKYHSWVVRGVVGLALKAVPDMQTFQRNLAQTKDDSDLLADRKNLMIDIENYITALDVILKILQDFYTANNLDDDQPV